MSESPALKKKKLDIITHLGWMIQLLNPGYLLEINHRVELRPVLLLVVHIQKCFVLYVKKQGKATFYPGLPRLSKECTALSCSLLKQPRWP